MRSGALYVLMFLLVCSCNSTQDESRISNNNITDSVMSESTAYVFPDMEIPAGFYSDTLTVYDALSRANYVSYFFVSSKPEMKEFNKAITAAMERQINYEKSFVEPYYGDSPSDPIYTYDLGPVKFYSDERLISITHVADTYTEGGNHHNYSWFTFNFDLKKNRVICFSDVFILKNHKDSVDFVEFVIRNEVEDCMDWSLPFDSVDFSFTDSGIFINPELSWACAQNRSFIPDDSLDKNFISKWVKNK